MKFKAFCFASLLFTSSSIFADSIGCPSGDAMQFHQTADKNIGYWEGYTNKGLIIKSDIMTIPSSTYEHGFRAELNSAYQNEKPFFVSCYYLIKDKKTHRTTSNFLANSEKQMR